MIFNFKKYRYLGNVNPEIPCTWNIHIMEMLQGIDKLLRPSKMPLYFLNIVSKISPALLRRIVGDIHIDRIYQKFAELKVKGVFNEDIKKIINVAETKCGDTCEFCGANHTSHVMIKSWVRNICITCKEAKKYGSNRSNNSCN